MLASHVSDNFPKHIAIIMDGNGRWAKARHKPRIFGHKEGVKTVRRIVEDASEMGVKCLTLYSFSTENWSRPKAEVAALFGLLKLYIKDDLQTLYNRGVRIRILGSRNGLSQDILALLDNAEETTKANTEFSLNIAFNYGGRDEIIRAARAFAKDVKNGTHSIESLDENGFEAYLDTTGLPSPDLVVRTSGEHRISNFLIWQAAYAEFVFSDVLWPDYKAQDLQDAIHIFQNRDRRFGGVEGVQATNEAEVA